MTAEPDSPEPPSTADLWRGRLSEAERFLLHLLVTHGRKRGLTIAGRAPAMVRAAATLEDEGLSAMAGTIRGRPLWQPTFLGLRVHRMIEDANSR